MFQRVLVGSDGSPTASKALERAALVASATGAGLHVVYAYELAAAGGGPFAGEAGPSPVEVGKGVLTSAQKRFEDVEVTTELAESDVVEALARTAASTGADLVVVGNVGLGSALKRLSSIAGRISHHPPADVLIVHTSDARHREAVDAGHDLEPYGRVIVGVDGSPTATAALRRCCELVAATGATLTVAYVGAKKTDEAEADRILGDALSVASEAGVDVERAFVRGKVGEQLVELAGQQADVVVVGNKGMEGWASSLRNPVAQHVSAHAPCDVLIVKTTS